MEIFWDIVLLPESSAFTISIQIVLILFVVEIIDLVFIGGILGTAMDNLIDFDLDADVDSDFDTDLDADLDADLEPSFAHRLLSWLYVGKVPIMVLTIILLTSFGLIGWALQYGVYMILGGPLPSLIAVFASLFIGLIATHYIAMPLARFMPSDESYAVDANLLVGLTAKITQGTARRDLSARAVVSTENGTMNVQVIPAEEGVSYPRGTRVVLQKKLPAEYDLFEVVPAE